MIKQIGKYNVEYVGVVYFDNEPYETAIFTEFDNNDQEINKRVLYFRTNRLNEKRYVIPTFDTEDAIKEMFEYDNYTILECYFRLEVRRIGKTQE